MDSVISANWTFTVTDKIYQLNDISINTSADVSMLILIQIKNLAVKVSKNILVFLRLNIPEKVYVKNLKYLNINP